MKTKTFIFSLLIFISIFSCKDDDDSNDNPVNETLVGVWNLKSVTPVDGDNAISCNSEVTSIEFLEVQNDTLLTVIIKSFLVTASDCRPEEEGTYTSEGDVTFGEIPPPKKEFEYEIKGDSLTLKTTEILDITYVFRKN
jgi:hypothetical protein